MMIFAQASSDWHNTVGLLIVFAFLAFVHWLDSRRG
jgi:cyanate permease